MSRYAYIFLFLSAILIVSNTCFGQVADSTETTAPVSSAGSELVDLSAEAVIIKIEPERPRVNIIADRVKPEFDNINLDKSFINELTGKGEKIIVVDQKVKDKFKTIEVNKIINRSR